MKSSCRILSVAALMSFVVSIPAHAIEWRAAIGAHDFVVDQASSHTPGLNVGLAFTHFTDNNILLAGKADVLVDIDHDKLDPDHIPVWFQSAYLARGNLYHFSPQMSLDWQVDVAGRRNTVSSIEQQFKFFPGLALNYQQPHFSARFKASAGYYQIELDDDVPKSLGYKRDDLKFSSQAFSLAMRTSIYFTSKLSLSAMAQQWHDGDQWLENKFGMHLDYDVSQFKADSLLVLSIEHHQYNLDLYQQSIEKPDAAPVLPWDRDTLVRLYLDIPWSF